MTSNRNFDNRTLFWGDNIDFMRAMNSETVDLIATDPPFNKGRDFHATPDSLAAGASFQDRWKWDEEAHPQFTDALRDDPKNADVWTVIQSSRSSWGDDMGAFLCFMGVRLMEMRRLLKPTGSIYLHCDPTASHYLKALMDAVFGRKNFRNEIIWQRTITRKGNLTRGLAADHDVLLRYSMSDSFMWNSDAVTLPYDMDNLDEKTAKKYASRDPQGRLYSLTSITAPVQDPNSSLTYEVMGVTRTWRWARSRMQKAIEDGIVVQTKRGNVPRQIRYLDEQKGKTLNSVWTDIPALNSQAIERTGYPTQKPLVLYERMIRASTSEGDLVLDPFAGCATTAVAAERLNRQWVAIDLWQETKNLIVSRLEAEKRMFAVEQLTVTQTPPARTDEGEVASPDLRLRMSRQPEKWQRLYRQQIFDYLQDAQTNSTGLVSCAGCGRSLEYEFMELDHILPRSEGGENYITNRILLCRPCNGWKSNNYTLAGLRNRNKREGWMRDEVEAESAQLRARRKADEIRETLE